jgi:hypothetical protein
MHVGNGSTYQARCIDKQAHFTRIRTLQVDLVALHIAKKPEYTSRLEFLSQTTTVEKHALRAAPRLAAMSKSREECAHLDILDGELVGGSSGGGHVVLLHRCACNNVRHG